jgi:hypothetical protein
LKAALARVAPDGPSMAMIRLRFILECGGLTPLFLLDAVELKRSIVLMNHKSGVEPPHSKLDKRREHFV